MEKNLKINSNSEEKKFNQGTEAVTISMGDKIIFCLVIAYLIIIISAIVSGILFGHTEKSEWLIFQIGSVLTFFLAAGVGRFRSLANNRSLNRIIRFSPIIGLIFFVTHSLFLTFYFRIIDYGFWLLIFGGLAPVIYLYRKNFRNLVRLVLIEGVLLFCVGGYFFEFFEYFKHFGILRYLFVLIAWTLLSLVILALTKIKTPKVSGKFVTAGIFFLVVLAAFNSTRKIMDYWNYSNFVGPAYELSLGKSLLNDRIPSLYGYLSVHFIKLILTPFGLNFENFHFLNINLFFLYYLGFYFAYKKIFKDNLLVLLFSLVTTFLSTRFYVSEVRGLPPSWGPLRHGFGLLIILALLYLPEKVNYWLISFLAGMTVFWSPEVAVYVVPAFLFTCLVKAIVRGKKLSKIIVLLVGSLIPFVLITLGLFLGIALRESGGQGLLSFISRLSHYFLFAGLFKNTPINGALIMRAPVFGNYYLAVLVLIIGLCLVFIQEWKTEKNKLFLPLSFLAIYNVAALSYFVSNSAPITLEVISCFILLELALIFRYFQEDKGFWPRIFLPGTLFLTVFSIICIWNFLGLPPKTYEKEFLSIEKVLADYQILKVNYGLTSENVLLLSKFYDTPLIIANQIKTIWPLNPSATTILTPNYIENYLIPNMDKVKIGTKLVYTEDLPPEFSDFLNNNYVFEEINPAKRVGIFKVYNFKPRSELNLLTK
ncbi:MAG: hypothetical protein BWY24_00624 [Microgenomates group bacterium ADurb.Bin219]|nr:MAG: hypothetical protein BWY24_00624 [Microgenomates group bacterium ADurb.Bin219]